MDERNIQKFLNRNYNVDIQSLELFRRGGNVSYVASGKNNKYFLKIIRPPFLETAVQSVDIQMYLLRSLFPAIPIVPSTDGAPYARVEDEGQDFIFIVYEFIEGGEPDPQDTEKAGELTGKLHQAMKDYAGILPKRDKYFFVDRYIDQLRSMHYPKAEAFLAYGNELWEKVKDLPRGYCHCDLYRGNIHKANSNVMYVVDFDTSCTAFPMYDAALFCNDTNYFNYDRDGYFRSEARLESFLKGYMRHYTICAEEISSFFNMIALYHFQLQATMIELHGTDSFTHSFFERQYQWLLRWKEQCGERF